MAAAVGASVSLCRFIANSTCDGFLAVLLDRDGDFVRVLVQPSAKGANALKLVTQNRLR